MPERSPLSRRLRFAAGTVLVGYWLLMFTLTHWPRVKLEGFPTNTDKVLHFTGYAGFGFLMAVWISAKRTFGPRDFAAAFAVAFIYGIADESTQPWFGRDCEFLDMVADWLGALGGLAMFLLVRIAVGRLILRLIEDQG